uniref:Uncharacterized protein n=1 Tax=Anguilla anguilla TaxID=7936 RepID=A0A0E9WBN6_ANGAN
MLLEPQRIHCIMALICREIQATSSSHTGLCETLLCLHKDIQNRARKQTDMV